MSRGVQVGPHRFPRRGTKRRQLLIELLRPQGIASQEAVNTNLVLSSGAFLSVIDAFTDFLNFHIVSWKRPPTGRKGPRYVAHRIVGRWREDGKYLDYLARKVR